jgi:hypothetical protein
LLATASAVTALGVRSLPASAQDGEVKLIVFGDIVQGSKNVAEEDKPARSCVLSSRFPRNSQMVWRMKVVDPATGEMMTDETLEKVEVTLSDGQVFEMEYGPHPPAPNPPRDSYWTVPWLVPEDYPTGTLGYTVTATAKDGRTGEFKPIDIAPSLPTITEEVLTTIE